MKKFLLIVWMLGVAVPAWAFKPVRALGQPYNGLQASLVPSKTAYTEGEPVDLTLVLTNVSAKTIDVDQWFGDWFVEVMDSGNMLWPHTQAVDVMRVMSKPEPLKAGESWKTDVSGLKLDGLWQYEPLKPGTYSLVAVYNAPIDTSNSSAWTGGVYSQAAQIDVLAAGAALEAVAEHPTAQDNDVLNVALSDLLAYGGQDSPLTTATGPPEKIRFAAEPEPSPQTEEQALRQYPEEPWKKLSAEQMSKAREAAQNLHARTGEHDAFVSFQPAKPGIEVVPHVQKTTVENIYVRPIRAWRPGYSADGTVAIVRLSIPWSIHSADGTYILSKNGGSWALLLRQFIIYV